jgi:uncharacterized protein YdeI (YjbR/CyaY-like superfamily)
MATEVRRKQHESYPSQTDAMAARLKPAISARRRVIETVMAAVTPDPRKIHAFASAAAFERWLAEEHGREKELWLKIHKKGSGLPSVSYAEALQIALCWGWIDGIKKSFDEHSFLQRYTPRKATSRWSQINCAHVERLISEGRMQAPGLREIEAAKADGRWQRAYAPIKSSTVPSDLLAAIHANPKARATFDTLNNQNRFALGFRLDSLRTEAARAKRLAEYVAMLARGETLLPNPAPRKKVEAKTAQAATSAKAKKRKRARKKAKSTASR